jgi:hypothetical protein
VAYTLGEFADSLAGVAQSLQEIADQLKMCEQTAEIDKTPGKTFICQSPIVAGSACGLPDEFDRFTVADLVEVVEGIQSWVQDVQSKIGSYGTTTPLEGTISEDIPGA